MLQPPGHPCRHCRGTGRHATLGACPECYGTGHMHIKDVDRRLSDIERRLAEYDALAGYRAFVHACIKSGEMPATFEEYVARIKGTGAR